MKSPPSLIDNAVIIEYAMSDMPFGVVVDTNGENPVKIYGLAICKYDKSEIIYRFSCDENWVTVSDIDYDSVMSAKEELPMQYRNAPIRWEKAKNA